mgnify:CR=1 FL=1
MEFYGLRMTACNLVSQLGQFSSAETMLGRLLGTMLGTLFGTLLGTERFCDGLATPPREQATRFKTKHPRCGEWEGSNRNK